MTLRRLEHTGAAPTTGLASGIGTSDTSFSVVNGAGYPTGAVGYFIIKIDAGSPTEEKILCSARSGNTFTVATSGRGYDSTSAASHSAGTNNVEHDLSATEIDDLSDHVYTTTRDDHTQYSKADGTRAFTGGVTINTGGLTVTAGGATVTAGTTAVQALTATTGVFSSTVTGTALIPSGLTGATAASRHVGGTTSGSPASGTFAVGDFVIDQTGVLWVCITAGTPGTWTQIGAGAVPACSVYRNAALTLPGSQGLLTFDTVTFDNKSAYSVSTGLYTVPQAGIYQVTVEVSGTPGDTNWLQSYIYKNGTTMAKSSYAVGGNAGGISAVSSGLVQCSLNDTLAGHAASGGGTTALVTGAAYTYMDIVRVSA